MAVLTITVQFSHQYIPQGNSTLLGYANCSSHITALQIVWLYDWLLLCKNTFLIDRVILGIYKQEEL